ncbi:TetR/AcrR family transcriptional regulator [Agrobacterium radiobacter]|uniref:TetR/AcrR family transcriptional regulator n=1 Tax=Agrobacterium radiobacter TaxID=362 RepID=UPI003F843610
MSSEQTPRGRGRPRKSVGPIRPVEPSKADQILDTALSHFARDGFDAASLRKIASDVGVHVALIGHNYGSKDDLWRAVIDRVADQLASSLEAVPAYEAENLSKGMYLPQIMSHLVDIVCDTPQLAQFILREVAQQDERFKHIYERLAKPIHDSLLPGFQASQPSVDGRPFDPNYLLFAFTGSIAMTVASKEMLACFSASAASDETFREELKHTLIGGFGAILRTRGTP